MNAIRLLIVDDEERFLSTHKKLLEKRGLNTDTCTNGFDALRILKELPIDVVLLDVKMPGIGGVEVLRKIKQDHPDVEVVMLTGHVGVESEMEGLKLGAFGYLTKPVTIAEIQAKVEEAFVNKRAKQERIREAVLGTPDRSSPLTTAGRIKKMEGEE